MHIFLQLTIIFAFAYAGEIISHLLPFTLPASVIGILLLLAAVSSGLLRQNAIRETAAFLSANMAFFFLPYAVNILSDFAHMKPVLWQLILISVVSTLATFAASYLATRGTQKLLEQIAKRR